MSVLWQVHATSCDLSDAMNSIWRECARLISTRSGSSPWTSNDFMLCQSRQSMGSGQGCAVNHTLDRSVAALIVDRLAVLLAAIKISRTVCTGMHAHSMGSAAGCLLVYNKWRQAGLTRRLPKALSSWAMLAVLELHPNLEANCI